MEAGDKLCENGWVMRSFAKGKRLPSQNRLDVQHCAAYNISDTGMAHC